MSDENSAALAGNTSRLKQGLPQYNHLLSLVHMEPPGKALHQWHTQEEIERGGVDERKERLQCCSKEWYTHFYIYSELMVMIEWFCIIY